MPDTSHIETPQPGETEADNRTSEQAALGLPGDGQRPAAYGTHHATSASAPPAAERAAQALKDDYDRKREAARDRKRLQRARENAERLTHRKSAETSQRMQDAITDDDASQDTQERDEKRHSASQNRVTGHRLKPSDIEEGSPSRIMLPPDPGGRPVIWTTEKAHEWQDKLLRWIECGNSLASFVRANPDGPSLTVWAEWREPTHSEYPKFAGKYLRARETGADYLAESVVEIADSVKDAGRDDSAKVNAARLAVDARKWVASKLKPREYADRTENFHQHNHNVSGKVEITDADRAAFLAGLARRQAIADSGSLPDAMKVIEGHAVEVPQVADKSGDKASKTDAA